jgi:AP-1 complex subunit beta-1
MKYLDVIRSPEIIRTLTKKMGAPLVTLLSKEPELQYVALRNIILILQKRPTVLQSELKVFFCKYNDPLYVKMEKLEIMIMLVNERNVDQVLMELKEYVWAWACWVGVGVGVGLDSYCINTLGIGIGIDVGFRYATAADVEFVRKAVAAIGHTAIKLARAAERCIHVLLELIETGYNPVVQEAMIVIKVSLFSQALFASLSLSLFSLLSVWYVLCIYAWYV